MSDIEVLDVIQARAIKRKRRNGKFKGKRKRTSSGLIEESKVMKGTETEFEEFVVDRTKTPQRKLTIKDVEKSGEGLESASPWRQQIESTLLGSIPDDKEQKKPTRSRPRKSCFNCDGEHNLRDCSRPKDFRRIAQRKRQSADEPNRKQPAHSNTGGLSKQKNNNFIPGHISEKLRAALGIQVSDIPEHVYRMRRLGFIKGYPPGYLRKAIKSSDFIKVFDSESTGNEQMEKMKPPVLDMSKIVCYPGFNGKSSMLNDREVFKVPPMDAFCSGYQEELTEIFKRQQELEIATTKKINSQKRSVSKHKKFTDDDDIIIIEDKKSKNENDCFSTPGEDGNVVILNETIRMEDLEETTPSRKVVEMGQSMFELVGTPVFAPDSTTIPSLEKFAEGIQPFRAEVDDIAQKGNFRNIMQKLKEARAENTKTDDCEEITVHVHDDSSEFLQVLGPTVCETPKKFKNKKFRSHLRNKKKNC